MRWLATHAPPPRSKDLVADKAISAGATSLEGLVAQLPAPRTVWLMVPAAAAVDETLDQLVSFLSAGDTIVYGGNSYYHDDIRRSRTV